MISLGNSRLEFYTIICTLIMINIFYIDNNFVADLYYDTEILKFLKL